MKNSVCILLLCAVRCSSLKLIDVPTTFQFQSNDDERSLRARNNVKRTAHFRPKSYVDSKIRFYVKDPQEYIPQKYYKKTRRIPTMFPNVHNEDKYNSKNMASPFFVGSTEVSASEKVTIGLPLKLNKNYPPVRSTTAKFDIRRYLPMSNGNLKMPSGARTGQYEDEKDANLKTKISTLVQQTIHDTERKIKSIQQIKEKHREEAPYKAGFILSLIKKSRDVLNELFNVAVKHKDEWRALEQLKIFELIVHTNVDTTNLVRQLVEIHLQHLNSTNPNHENNNGMNRVVVM